ncbi:MAG: ABC transporter permease [Myxococcales bacterium]|nr:ABC transporter permease [Myxococcales bacterium]MCB9549837.1 ABC transporter permease [Myxococcales bacterium]
MKAAIEAVGQSTLNIVEGTGKAALLFFETLVWTIRPPYRLRLLFQAMEFVGVGSMFIVLLTGVFTGAVFALQGAGAFRLFNAESLVGPTVGISLARELAPVLTGLMVAGRAGSGIATELGTMRVTEQIDALYTMAVNPVQYLVVPRFLAGITMVPCLCALFSLVGMVGCYFVGVVLLRIDEGIFMEQTKWLVDPDDLTSGMIKALVFGGILTMVGCYKGFYASGGARGVGLATTQAVVGGSVLILIADYFLTALMFQ